MFVFFIGMAADATGPFDGQVWMFAMTRKLLYYIFVLRVSLIFKPTTPPTPHPLHPHHPESEKRLRLASANNADQSCIIVFVLFFFPYFLFCFHFPRWTTLPCRERWAELIVALRSPSTLRRSRIALTCRCVTLGRSLCAQYCLLRRVNREGTCSSVKVRKSTMSA